MCVPSKARVSHLVASVDLRVSAAIVVNTCCDSRVGQTVHCSGLELAYGLTPTPSAALDRETRIAKRKPKLPAGFGV
jgi:hypothetical protein